MPRKDTAEKDPVTKDDTKGQKDAAADSTDKGKGIKPKTQKQKAESSASKHTPGFAEGNSVLQGYNLSVSGRMERILSPFKGDKFFHFVSDAWSEFTRLKPHIIERFSYAEFRHMSALQLYNRLEAVKFDALGVKQPAPTRIPLPRDTRVFQPIWSVLANIGVVEDPDLRAIYIPDGIVPKSKDLTHPDDIENLLSCTLYDWESSWKEVVKAREARKQYQQRTGLDATTDSNETTVQLSKEELIAKIQFFRKEITRAEERERSPEFELVKGVLRKIKAVTAPSSPSSSRSGKDNGTEATSPKKEYEQETYWTVSGAKNQLEAYMQQAKKLKSQMIAPKFDVTHKIESYRISDGTITTSPGSYGEWMRWDPQLYIDYENFVTEVTPMALFSLSMPAESKGTYAWILPVEKREDDDSSVSARMPRASIPTATWVLALLLQSSTLPLHRRSTWYTETDRLQNVLGVRRRYIKAAIKDPTAVEQYGTI